VCIPNEGATTKEENGMVVSGTLEERLIHRVFANEKFHGETEYMIESGPAQGIAPQAFLATQAADWTLPVHYHLQEQFQVVVEGSGKLGPHRLQPLVVHYASREAGYGPVVAGQAGLKYLTLRAISDAGAWYLPEARERMRRDLRKKQLHAGPWQVSPSHDLLALAEPQVEAVIPPQEDGLAGWIVRAGPGQVCDEPVHAGGGGRFLVVVAGQIELGGRRLGRLACTFASREEPAVRLHAGAQGAEILVLQYPHSALEPLVAA
jgi:hypothetical protein